MDLASKMASGNYKGFVTFSDIHAHAEKLKQGIRYAIKNDLFIVFLGDMVDGHSLNRYRHFRIEQFITGSASIGFEGDLTDSVVSVGPGGFCI